MCGAILLLIQYAFMAWAGITLHFTQSYVNGVVLFTVQKDHPTATLMQLYSVYARRAGIILFYRGRHYLCTELQQLV